MQNHSRWVLALAKTANIKFCVGNTNMLVSKNAKICVTPDTYFKICFTPNAKPQRESVEYRLPWALNAKFLRWACTFHVVCVNFIHFGEATHMQFSVKYGLESSALLDLLNSYYNNYKSPLAYF